MAQTLASLMTHTPFNAKDRVVAFFKKNLIAYDERYTWQ
jgi:hypothetical protein